VSCSIEHADAGTIKFRENALQDLLPLFQTLPVLEIIGVQNLAAKVCHVLLQYFHQNRQFFTTESASHRGLRYFLLGEPPSPALSFLLLQTFHIPSVVPSFEFLESLYHIQQEEYKHSGKCEKKKRRDTKQNESLFRLLFVDVPHGMSLHRHIPHD
jgi:hypothetical protein